MITRANKKKKIGRILSLHSLWRYAAEQRSGKKGGKKRKVQSHASANIACRRYLPRHFDCQQPTWQKEKSKVVLIDDDVYL